MAYYATAPDLAAGQAMANGPEVLKHYAHNPAINQFLVEQGLDVLLWSYQPSSPTLDLTWLATPERDNFLQKPAAVELFSRNGLIDINKIHNAYTVPLPPISYSAGGKRQNNAITSAAANNSSSNYMSIALEGLSDWIGRRAQEELTYTFLTRLREQLQRNGLNHLFPHTVGYLPTLNLINYKAILPSIRLAFAQDLNQLSLSLGNFLEAKERSTYINPAVYNLFLVYRLLDLGARELPLADIVAYTYEELAATRLNTAGPLT
ncbi:MAG: hypothetical protein HC821_05980 [Lewinella sp.]|nr:hypothetical protein [Lewinella sp.]